MNCVSLFEPTMFRKSHFPLIVIYEMLHIVDNYCFHQRVVFLISWVFPFALAYSFGIVSVLNLRCVANLIVPLIVIYEMLQIADNYCFHQRVVFLISLRFPCTLAYRFGVVCLFWIQYVSQICFSMNFEWKRGFTFHHQRVVFLIS